MALYIGVDVGGTKIAAAIVDVQTGATLKYVRAPTDAHLSPEAVLTRIAQLITSLPATAGLAQTAIAGVGIGMPGHIDMVNGQTLFWATAAGGWRTVPITATLHQQTGYPTWLINDACAFTLAEVTWGAARGVNRVVGVTLGTGIGGGIAIDGRLYLGMDGAAAEIGHQTLDPDGPQCPCGNTGCLETFASGPAISALAVKAILHGQTTAVDALVDHDIRRVTPETVLRAAEAGDAVATDILTRVGGYLGLGIANIITIVAPERIVIGGSVARLGERLFAPMRETIQRRCRIVPAHRVEIVQAACGDSAGIIGAALWAAQGGFPENEGQNE